MSKTNNSTLANFVAALFFIAVVAFGLFVFSSFFSKYSHAQASSNWPQVNGKIVVDASRSGVDAESGKEIVSYEYAVDGKIYRACNEKFFEPDSLSTRQAGNSVKVFYDPKHPQDACLVPGVSSITTARIVVFLSILFGGIIAISCFFYQSAYSKKEETAGSDRERVQAISKLNEWSHN